jgi:CheY-like chemotaxis protein
MLEKEYSGFELARKLRANQLTSKIKIVMLSSISEKTGLNFKQDAGKEKYLPVDAFFDKTDQPASIMLTI